MEINVVYGFFVVDFMHFASRRKIINHHVAGGTRESHPHVQDLQHPRVSLPRHGLQMLDTQYGFPGPSSNVVIDSTIPFEGALSLHTICILVHVYKTIKFESTINLYTHPFLCFLSNNLPVQFVTLKA